MLEDRTRIHKVFLHILLQVRDSCAGQAKVLGRVLRASDLSHMESSQMFTVAILLRYFDLIKVVGSLQTKSSSSTCALNPVSEELYENPGPIQLSGLGSHKEEAAISVV